MCSRYFIDEEVQKEIEKLAEISEHKKDMAECDIHPSDLAPILVGKKRNLVVSWKRWGFLGFGGKQLIFNARSESVMEKRMFCDSVKKRRAVIPAAHFYEWNSQKEKITFKRADLSVIFIAGFYQSFDDGDRFVILTTQANESVEGIHDRMPLIIEKEEWKSWIFDEDKTEYFLKKKSPLLQHHSEYKQQNLFENQ